MIKYTDSMGEVDFCKLRGNEIDYYAYVEGDRERQEYRFVTITWTTVPKTVLQSSGGIQSLPDFYHPADE